MNYRVLDGDIVFLTGEGTKLEAALRDTVVAFEVDEIDRWRHGGWSVLAVGVATEMRNGEELRRAQELGIRPWVDGNRTHFVRIRPEFLSGRRIVSKGGEAAASR